MKPVQPYHVCEGGNYWASWGSKGWTAVQVTSVRRKWARVTRVNPRTNEPKKRGAKVRLDEMVKRDPKLKGGDKPGVGPAEVFADVRQVREQSKAEQVQLAATKQAVDPEVAEAVDLRDGETNEERLARRWAHIEKHFGKDVVDGWNTVDDW